MQTDARSVSRARNHTIQNSDHSHSLPIFVERDAVIMATGNLRDLLVLQTLNQDFAKQAS